MKNIFIKAVLLLAISISVTSCKKDYIYGDIVPNTDRVIVEFTDSKNSGREKFRSSGSGRAFAGLVLVVIGGALLSRQ